MLDVDKHPTGCEAQMALKCLFRTTFVGHLTDLVLVTVHPQGLQVSAYRGYD